jgi:hypothetical protein
MKISHSLIIFLLAIIALVAEFVLFFIFGVGAAFSGDLSLAMGTGYFFVALILFTIAVGVLAPLSSLVGMLLKKPDLAKQIYASSLCVVVILLALYGLFGMNNLEKNTTGDTTGQIQNDFGSPRPSPTAQKQSATSLTVKEKAFVEADYMSGITSDQVTMTLTIV